MNAPARTTPAPHIPRVNLTLVREALRIGFAPTRRNVLHWASWGVTLTVLLVMTAALYSGSDAYGWEVDVTRWVQDLGYPDWLLMITAENLTNWDTPLGAVIISSVAAVLWLLRLRIESFLILFSVPLHVLGNFPKAIIERERPNGLIDGIEGPGGMKSFPSGHSEFAITFYGFLVYVALFYVHNRWQRAALIGGWLALVAAAGLGRLEEGVHWPLDIVAGYVAGIGLLSGLIWLHRSLYAARERVQ